MNKNIITSLIQIANICDEKGLYQIANNLTKIASDITEDEYSNIEGNFIKIEPAPSDSYLFKKFRIVTRIDGELKKREPQIGIHGARMDAQQIKKFYSEKGIPVNFIDFVTLEEKRAFEKKMKYRDRDRIDFEPFPYRKKD